MIRIRDIALRPGQEKTELKEEIARLLRIKTSDILNFQIIRRSVDARKKPDVRFIYTVDFEYPGNEKKLLRSSKKVSVVHPEVYEPPKKILGNFDRPVIVGFGPCGMFAALLLAQAGLRPIVLERGEDAETRHKKIESFWNGCSLDIHTNVQFGEGGAGTFSDGKLNTGVNDLRGKFVLSEFVRFGAKEEILYDAKPHVGTDVLLRVVQNIRHEIEALGGEVRFSSQVTDLFLEDEELRGLEINGSEILHCRQVILAIGHSARDTFEMLYRHKIEMEKKPFAMGVRIEHLQKDINLAQFGTDSKELPAADYKLAEHLKDRSVFTFCMCPGGYVVAAASEEGGVVTNGMSYSERNGANANAALLVSVTPEDFPGDDPLAGMRWQREIEKKAFRMGGENYCAPAERVGDFLGNGDAKNDSVISAPDQRPLPTYRPGVKFCDLHELYPKFITDALEEAIPLMDKKIQGFKNPNGILTAPETRSSSPVRILRNENRVSLNVKGLFPAGEGAGYAGGIMSAAIDGIYCAEELIRELTK